jgi:preprotein translocase subunit SecE
LQVRVLSALQGISKRKGKLMAEEFEASENLVDQAKADRAKARGPIGRLVLFFKQVLGELSKVTKPTVAELRNYTAVVLGFVVVVMVIISALDWGFLELVKLIFVG